MCREDVKTDHVDGSVTASTWKQCSSILIANTYFRRPPNTFFAWSSKKTCSWSFTPGHFMRLLWFSMASKQSKLHCMIYRIFPCFPTLPKVLRHLLCPIRHPQVPAIDCGISAPCLSNNDSVSSPAVAWFQHLPRIQGSQAALKRPVKQIDFSYRMT